MEHMSDRKTKTLYFDESNYTGHNLLDAVQPVFVIASSDIGDDEAADILRRSFPLHKGHEFKAVKAWKDRQKRSLVPFGSEVGRLKDRIYGYVTDKRFAVLTKAFDFLVEPIISNAGYDWYNNGYCWRYVNWVHFSLVQFAPPEVYEAIVTTYQAFSRHPSEEKLRLMQRKFRLMAESLAGEKYAVVLSQLALGAELFHQFSDLATFNGSDEMQVSTMVAIVAAWRQRFHEDFTVFHDNSANFYRRRALWEQIVGPDAPQHLHPLGDGTSVQFPLRVVETRGVDSVSSPAIQLCDLVAGLAARVRNPALQSDDATWLDPLLAAGFGELQFNGIYFRPEFPDSEPSLLNGPDAVDMMVTTIFR
jgi:hypothetical protein